LSRRPADSLLSSNCVGHDVPEIVSSESVSHRSLLFGRPRVLEENSIDIERIKLALQIGNPRAKRLAAWVMMA